MKILGIDPGYDRVGIAIIERSNKGKDSLLHSECFTTDPKSDFYGRLVRIDQKMESLLTDFKPDLLSIETLFITKNQKTAMRVSEARGVIAVAAAKHGVAIREYTPLQIKMAVTGDGASDKTQVMKMVRLLVKMDAAKRYDDEYDAIAAALACRA